MRKKIEAYKSLKEIDPLIKTISDRVKEAERKIKADTEMLKKLASRRRYLVGKSLALGDSVRTRGVYSGKAKVINDQVGIVEKKGRKYIHVSFGMQMWCIPYSEVVPA